MGIEFYNTGYGRKFFQADLPRIINALERIADGLEKKLPKDKSFEHLRSLAMAAQRIMDQGTTTDENLEYLETEMVRAFDYMDDVYDQTNK